MAASIFFAIAVGCAVIASVAFIDPWWAETIVWGTDTAPSVLIGVGIAFSLLAGGSVFGGSWLLRRWPSQPS